jgi:hypothetical protein
MPREPKIDEGWSRRVPSDYSARKWRLKRCPARGKLFAIILSHDLECRGTHFVGSRTQPCPGKACSLCRDGLVPRWLGWVAAWDCHSRDKVVLEFTAHCTTVIDDYFRYHKTLRGARVELGRRGLAANSEVYIRISEPDQPSDSLPTAPDIRPILERIWQVRLRLPEVQLEIAKETLRPTGTDGASPDVVD